MFINSMKKVLFSFTTLLALIALVAAGCSDDNDTSSASSTDKPSIVVTTNILGDVVTNMVGDSFNVEVIMPPGSDPHDFQASAQQVQSMMEADLLVVNGANFEEGMLDVIASAKSDGVMVFEAISVVSQLEGSDDHSDHGGHDDHEGHDDHDEDKDHDEEGHDDHDDHEGHDDHDDHEGHDHGGIDPHFFTDPGRMAVVVEGLSEFLIANFPNASQGFVSSASDYAQDLVDLDAEVKEILSEIPDEEKVLVTNHAVFAYFAESYGFEILGEIIPSASTLSSANAEQLASLADEISSNNVKAIFADASASDTLAQTLASEVGGIEVITLFTESLGDPGSSGANYIEMVKFNAQSIASGLVG